MSCMKPPVIIEISYFPLEVGNEWHYYNYFAFSFGSDSLIIKVESKERHNSKEYYAVYSYSPPRTEPLGSTLVRSENGRVYEFVDSVEYLIIDFTSDIMQSWIELPSNNIKTIISKTDTFSRNEKEIYNCIRYSIVDSNDSTVVIYGPDIGLLYLKMYPIKGASILETTYLEWAKIGKEKFVF